MGNGRMKDHWRDTDMRIEGPVIESLQDAFVENWLEATGNVLGGARISRRTPKMGRSPLRSNRRADRGTRRQQPRTVPGATWTRSIR
jgi:phosphatidylserine/phosphatidylglycerophosphate/cardiolipin synthase-like enzyme